MLEMVPPWVNTVRNRSVGSPSAAHACPWVYSSSGSASAAPPAPRRNARRPECLSNPFILLLPFLGVGQVHVAKAIAQHDGGDQLAHVTAGGERLGHAVLGALVERPELAAERLLEPALGEARPHLRAAGQRLAQLHRA